MSWQSRALTSLATCLRNLSRLQFEEIVADPAVVKDILVPATGSTLVPQVQLPDGRFVQDFKEIMDAVEKLWPAPLVLPPESCPKQRLLCHIVELLADEWLLVPAFHWRWAYSGDGSEAYRMPSFMGGVKPQPNHLQYNLEQWGAFLRPDGSREQQVRTANFSLTIFSWEALVASSDQWWPWESQMLLLPHGKHPAKTFFHSLRSTFGIIPLF